MSSAEHTNIHHLHERTELNQQTELIQLSMILIHLHSTTIKPNWIILTISRIERTTKEQRGIKRVSCLNAF